MGEKSPLRSHSFRLRPDQVEFLKSLPNAADFVRKAIDTAIIEASAVDVKEEKVIALSKKIAALRLQIIVLKEHAEYQRALRRIRKLEAFFKDEEEKILALYNAEKNLKIEGRNGLYFLRHPDNYSFCVRVSVEKPEKEKDFIKAEEKMLYEAWERGQQIIKNNFNELQRFKKEEQYLRRIIETYEKAIDHLKEQIQKLENDIIVIQ